MEQQILSFSKDTIKERKRIIYTMMAVMPVLIAVFAYIFADLGGDFNLKIMFGIMCFVIPLFLIELYVVSRITIKKISEMKLIIEEDKMIRAGGSFQEIILYEDIIHADVKRNPNGKIQYIKVRLGTRTINISGFDEIESVLSNIKHKISDVSLIREKQCKINWNNPIIQAAVMLATASIIILIIKLNIKVYELFNLIFPLAFGIIFLSYKPLSKNAGVRFRKFEIIISVLILGCGVLGFISAIM